MGLFSVLSTDALAQNFVSKRIGQQQEEHVREKSDFLCVRGLDNKSNSILLLYYHPICLCILMCQFRLFIYGRSITSGISSTIYAISIVSPNWNNTTSIYSSFSLLLRPRYLCFSIRSNLKSIWAQ